MSDTRDIEKKSLEAHVELCAERYRFLENKLENVDQKINALEDMMKKVYDMINDLSHRRNDQIISWGAGVVTLLIGVIGYLLAVYVIK
jgi:5-bromo-4-chloroindolyl phosphate hydrolysis protein